MFDTSLYLSTKSDKLTGRLQVVSDVVHGILAALEGLEMSHGQQNVVDVNLFSFQRKNVLFDVY